MDPECLNKNGRVFLKNTQTGLPFLRCGEKHSMALKVLSKDGFYGWVNLAVVFFLYSATMLMMASFGVFLDPWIKEFKWSVGWTSGAQQLCMILSGLAAPMVGRYIMKRGTRKAIVLGNLLNVGGLVLLACMKDMWQLYLGYGVLVGLGMAIGGMLATMTVINNWFIMKRSIALAVSMASMGLSGSVITPALIRLIDTFEWRNTYLIIAAITLLFCVIIPAIFLKNKPEDLGQVPDGPITEKTAAAKSGAPAHKNLYKTPVDFTATEAIRTRALWLMVAYVTLQFLTLNAILTHQLKFLYEIGIEKNTAGLAVGLFSAFMAISQLGVGFLGLRFNMHFLATLSMGVGIVGFAMLLVAGNFAEFPLIVFTYCILLGIGFGVQSIAMGNLIPDYFGRTEFPKIMGYTMPVTTLLSSFGATIPGIIRDNTGSYTLAFQLCLGLSILAMVCIIFAKPPVHPSLKKDMKPEEVNPEIQPALPINS
jgi:MFS family permease